jgi:hypothetical protein
MLHEEVRVVSSDAVLQTSVLLLASFLACSSTINKGAWQYASPKRGEISARLQNTSSRKTVLLIINAVRTPDFTELFLF